ncbi:uncharacterized protein [Gossypium hirsutum]|uniref:Uncharacterized protein isoform X1 n=1 Tax=Gossypium hirsutum TaxID=3635 RepID=A0ABM3BTL7_GOSHI|nr:uncharacterized protein LOC121229688 isoform X1 [Gossypium hirsutum]XP_040970410.1 uncharacterized protein LOC121229688 isoform X1 [Gossypium hirsutum]XP_040970411.1 uncharacterized protein LOC121229688 isoform X1 [Gossypium hirsutum]XP_040970413.1 uncharacterized protein LOC121229688 isoform X1 [Gossypium hirsutum]XP_040970414.1 uncharacterized protein LOC121229688 isoform X1 [Gossypium hirsutum]
MTLLLLPSPPQVQLRMPATALPAAFLWRLQSLHLQVNLFSSFHPLGTHQLQFQHYQQLQGKQLNLRHRIQKLGNVGIFPFGSTSAFTGSGSSIFGGKSAASSSAGTTAEVASSGNSSSSGVSSTITNSGSGFFSSTFSPVTSTSNGIFGGTSVGTSTGNGIFGGTSATTSTATGLFGGTSATTSTGMASLVVHLQQAQVVVFLVVRLCQYLVQEVVFLPLKLQSRSLEATSLDSVLQLHPHLLHNLRV